MKAVRVGNDLLLRVVSHLRTEDLNETAVPSYAHANPLIGRLFWQRLDAALDLARIRPQDRILDFGTGSGVFLPTLHAAAASVTATDLDISPGREMARTMGLPTVFVDRDDFASWADAHPASFDVIMALDVFEHLSEKELREIALRLQPLLAAGGRMIVSGPTESPMYKLGRMIAGFRNTYHYRSVFDIDAQLRKSWVSEESRFVPRFPRAFLLARYAPAAATSPSAT